MGSRGATSKSTKQLTSEQKEALDYYTEDGYYINNMLRNDRPLDSLEQNYIKLLDQATDAKVKQDTLYRIVDAKTIFEGINDFSYEDLRSHLILGDDAYDKGAYSQGIKARMEKMIQNSIGKTHIDKGYMSTTFDEETAQEKYSDDTHGRNKVLLRITNTKGAKGRDISKEYNRDYDIENEVLLSRGNKYKVNRIYSKDYLIYVDVELKR